VLSQEARNDADHSSFFWKRRPVRRSCRSFERRSEVGERRHRRERRERKTPSAKRQTPKAYKNLAQGGGLAEPWVLVVKARSSEGAKESVEPRAIKAAQYSRMTITCDVAGFLPLLQSGPRLTLNTQGSAEPPPWAKFLHRLRRYVSASTNCQETPNVSLSHVYFLASG